MVKTDWKALVQKLTQLQVSLPDDLKQYLRGVMEALDKPEEDLFKYRAVIMAIRMLGEALVKWYLKKRNQPSSIQKSTFKDLAIAVEPLQPTLADQIKRFAYIMNRVGANHVNLEKQFDLEDYKNALVESVKSVTSIYILVVKPKEKVEDNFALESEIMFEVPFRGTRCSLCFFQKETETPTVVAMRWKQRKNSFVKVLSLLPSTYFYYFILDGVTAISIENDYAFKEIIVPNISPEIPKQEESIAPQFEFKKEPVLFPVNILVVESKKKDELQIYYHTKFKWKIRLSDSDFALIETRLKQLHISSKESVLLSEKYYQLVGNLSKAFLELLESQFMSQISKSTSIVKLTPVYAQHFQEFKPKIQGLNASYGNDKLVLEGDFAIVKETVTRFYIFLQDKDKE